MSFARSPRLLAATLFAALGAASIALAAQPVLPPTVRPGDVFVVRPAPGAGAAVSARLFDATYPPLTVAGEAGPVFMMGIDLDAAPGAVAIVVRRSDGGEERLSLRIQKRDFPEERLTLPPALVTPPQELEERIAREQALAADIYRSSGAARLWEGGFTPPLEQRPAGNFGRRRILNGIPKSPHTGQDYTAPAGTPVKAIAGGTVRLAGDLYYSGQTIFVDHGSGLVSVYMHLERLLAAAGDTVVGGQVIGLVGSTGRATGAHLHLGARLFGQRVDTETLWGLFERAAPPGSAR